MRCKENWFQQQPLFHLLRYLMWGAVKLYGCHHLKCSCELWVDHLNWRRREQSVACLETHFGEKQLCLLTSVGVVYSQPFCKIDKKLKLTHIDHWMLLNIIAVAMQQRYKWNTSRSNDRAKLLLVQDKKWNNNMNMLVLVWVGASYDEAQAYLSSTLLSNSRQHNFEGIVPSQTYFTPVKSGGWVIWLWQNPIPTPVSHHNNKLVWSQQHPSIILPLPINTLIFNSYIYIHKQIYNNSHHHNSFK